MKFQLKEEVSSLEDKLLVLDKRMQTKFDDMENRSRRNYRLFHGIPEGLEGKDIHGCTHFIMKEFLHKFMKIPDCDMIAIERSHRVGRGIHHTKEPASSPRSVIVAFTHFPDKERIMFLAPKLLKQRNSETSKYSSLMTSRPQFVSQERSFVIN